MILVTHPCALRLRRITENTRLTSEGRHCAIRLRTLVRNVCLSFWVRHVPANLKWDRSCDLSMCISTAQARTNSYLGLRHFHCKFPHKELVGTVLITNCFSPRTANDPIRVLNGRSCGNLVGPFDKSFHEKSVPLPHDSKM